MPGRFDDEARRHADRQRLRAMIAACSEIARLRDNRVIPANVLDAWNCWQIVKIGEAARTLSMETKLTMTSIPWVQIVKMRNRLVHEYWQVDRVYVQHVVDKDADELRKAAEQHLKDEDSA